jgi:hypothetical protein
MAETCRSARAIERRWGVSDLDQPITGEWLESVGWRALPNCEYVGARWRWYCGRVSYSSHHLPHINTRGLLLLAMLAMGDKAPGTEVIERQLRAAKYVDRYGIICAPDRCTVWTASLHGYVDVRRADTWADAVIALGEHLDQQGASGSDIDAAKTTT